MLPMVKVDSIGAGGGTIARVDPVRGRLSVGPESAGSVPGPVCYDGGGSEPTVCDADLILGFLNPDYFLGGKMRLNKGMAEQTIREKIGTPLQMEVIEAAAGIFTIINSHMADLIRILTMRAGLSPEDFVLYAFGGTGPMHAAYYASDLGIKKVYCFPTSSVFSAFGIAGADIIRSISFSLGYPMPMDPHLLNSTKKKYENALAQELENEGFLPRDLEFRHTFNMRRVRQVLYHSVAVPAREYKSDEDVKWLMEQWVEDFERIYGKGVGYGKANIEAVSMDIDAVGKVIKPSIKRHAGKESSPSAALKGYRDVFFPEITKDFLRTAIYEYGQLQADYVIEGPAVVESPTTTIVIPPEKIGKVDDFLNVVLEL